jgi:ferredoxin
MYPDECWLCGSCVEYCKEDGAITLVHTLSQRVNWKRKDTGEFYRIGMHTPPPPNTKPLVR